MIYSSQGGLSEIEPSASRQELEQINNLFSTQKGTVPLRRDFGLSADALTGSNVNVAAARLSAEIGEAFSKYIPRFYPADINVEYGKDGGLTFSVNIALKEGG